MEPGVSASDPPRPLSWKASLTCGQEREHRGVWRRPSEPTPSMASGPRPAILSPQELIWKADGTHLTDEETEAPRVSWPKAVLGELDWWSSPCKAIHLGPSVQKAHKPAAEAVRAEALRSCLITACGAQLPQQGRSSPPAVAFSPRSKCLGKRAWSWWGLIPEPGQMTAGAESQFITEELQCHT